MGRDVDEELSIGDFVLTGGELAAMVVVDAVTRLVPGVIEPESLAQESHTGGLLEGPQYTRPVEHEGKRVPSVLLSGDHAMIERWRRGQAIRRTAERRPELLDRAAPTPSDRARLPRPGPRGRARGLEGCCGPAGAGGPWRGGGAAWGGGVGGSGGRRVAARGGRGGRGAGAGAWWKGAGSACRASGGRSCECATGGSRSRSRCDG